MGRLETMVIGPMFSGKSTYLIAQLKRLIVAGKRCLVIKYQKDTRYHPDCLVTHDNSVLTIRDDSPSFHYSCERLGEIPEAYVANAEIIAIDEAQFFEDLYDFVLHAIEYHPNVSMHIAALDTWHTFAPCKSIIHLIPCAEEVIKKTAICKACGSSNALCTYKIPAITDSTTETSLVEIGGSERYAAMCIPCYKRHTT